jgi:hypothetical protein
MSLLWGKKFNGSIFWYCVYKIDDRSKETSIQKWSNGCHQAMFIIYNIFI